MLVLEQRISLLMVFIAGVKGVEKCCIGTAVGTSVPTGCPGTFGVSMECSLSHERPELVLSRWV